MGFKVGDRVRIAWLERHHINYKVGDTGVILRINAITVLLQLDNNPAIINIYPSRLEKINNYRVRRHYDTTVKHGG